MQAKKTEEKEAKRFPNPRRGSIVEKAGARNESPFKVYARRRERKRDRRDKSDD